MEIHYYQKFHHFMLMPFFENFAPLLPLDSEPATPLLLPVNYFYQKSSSQLFDWVLNTPLCNIDKPRLHYTGVFFE